MSGGASKLDAEALEVIAGVSVASSSMSHPLHPPVKWSSKGDFFLQNLISPMSSPQYQQNYDKNDNEPRNQPEQVCVEGACVCMLDVTVKGPENPAYGR
jgi:hypothetical protein